MRVMTDDWIDPDDSVYIGEPRTRDGWVMLVAAEVFRQHGNRGHEYIARKLQRFKVVGNEKGMQTLRGSITGYSSLSRKGQTDTGAPAALLGLADRPVSVARMRQADVEGLSGAQAVLGLADMSVDLYVALPAAHWPTATSLQQCMTDRAYPVQIKRFPTLNDQHIVTDGVLATIDGQDAYLEGEVAPASAMPSDVKNINDLLSATSAADSVKLSDLLMSIRARSPAEMRAASYVVSALIVCFDGFGFEPQGNAHGRVTFAQSLVSGAEALKGL